MKSSLVSTRPNRLASAVLAGFTAAFVMLLGAAALFGLAAGFASLELAGSQAQEVHGWFSNLTHNSLVDPGRADLYWLTLAHFGMGVFWALVYAYGAEPYLQGEWWQKGAVFALLPFLVSLVIVLPLSGAGLAGAAIGAGPLLVAGSLVLHLIYGASLGAVYGPFGATMTDGADSTEEERRVLERSMTTGAVGIGVGALAGLAAGLVARLVAGGGPTADVAGANPAIFALVLVIGGGAVGGLVGSMAGLSAASPRPLGTSSELAVNTSDNALSGAWEWPSELQREGKRYSSSLTEAMQRVTAEYSGEALGKVDIFRGMPGHLLGQVAALGELVVIHQGEALARQGEEALALYAILDGQVELTALMGSGDITLRVATEGQALPLACLLGEGKLVTSAYAMTDVVALRIAREPLMELCRQRAEIRAHIYQAIAEVAMARYRHTVGRLTTALAQALRREEFWVNV